MNDSDESIVRSDTGSTVVNDASAIVATQFVEFAEAELARPAPSLIDTDVVRGVGDRLESILALTSEIADSILESARLEAAQIRAVAEAETAALRDLGAVESAEVRRLAQAEIDDLRAAAGAEALALRSAADQEIAQLRAAAISELDAAVEMRQQAEVETAKERADALARAEAVAEMAARGMETARAAIAATEQEAGDLIAEVTRRVAQRIDLARHEFEVAAGMLHAPNRPIEPTESAESAESAEAPPPAL